MGFEKVRSAPLVRSSYKPGVGPGMPRSILHLDLDAFYAAVEVLDRPELRGKPVIVGGGENRGVVAAASYEARRFGVHSAMAIARAKRLCPGGIYLPVRMSRYSEMSDRVFAIYGRFTPLVEPLSIDEAFLDVTGCERLFGSAEETARKIKETVRRETGLIVSAGAAPNKFLAKIASDMGKPDGLVVVHPGEEQAFLDPLPVGKVWGVGKVTEGELARMGIRTIKDLRRTPRETLVRSFGAQGTTSIRSPAGSTTARSRRSGRRSRSATRRPTTTTCGTGRRCGESFSPFPAACRSGCGRRSSGGRRSR